MRLLQVLTLVIALEACGPTFEEIEKAATSGDVSAQLKRCRHEAREAFYIHGKSEAEAMAVYAKCKKREGL